MALVAGTLGTALWVALAPLLGPLIFPDVSVALVMLAGLCVLTRLVTITAKSCSQGSDDLRGANRIIFAEEFLFLPAYGLVWGLLGVHGYAAVIAAMLMADGAAASFGWARLVRRGFLRAAAPPSFELGRRVAAYGMRAQVGGVMSQLNLRLDFVILSILTGPAVLGVYAVASKFAELVKVLGLALTYVFYPKFARGGRLNAVADVQRLIPKAGAITGCLRRRTLGQRRLRDSRALRTALQFGSYPHEDHPAGSPARGGGRSHHRVLVRGRSPGPHLLGDGPRVDCDGGAGLDSHSSVWSNRCRDRLCRLVSVDRACADRVLLVVAPIPAA